MTARDAWRVVVGWAQEIRDNGSQMLRFSHEGQFWRVRDDAGEARGNTPMEALEALQGRPWRRGQRWVLYVGRGDLRAFAEAVVRAGGDWKPVAVDRPRMRDAVEAVQPELVVIETRDAEGEALLSQTVAEYGHNRVVLDDRRLPVVTKLLELAA